MAERGCHCTPPFIFFVFEVLQININTSTCFFFVLLVRGLLLSGLRYHEGDFGVAVRELELLEGVLADPRRPQGQPQLLEAPTERLQPFVSDAVAPDEAELLQVGQPALDAGQRRVGHVLVALIEAQPLQALRQDREGLIGDLPAPRQVERAEALRQVVQVGAVRGGRGQVERSEARGQPAQRVRVEVDAGHVQPLEAVRQPDVPITAWWLCVCVCVCVCVSSSDRP